MLICHTNTLFYSFEDYALTSSLFDFTMIGSTGVQEKITITSDDAYDGLSSLFLQAGGNNSWERAYITKTWNDDPNVKVSFKSKVVNRSNLETYYICEHADFEFIYSDSVGVKLHFVWDNYATSQENGTSFYLDGINYYRLYSNIQASSSWTSFTVDEQTQNFRLESY